MSQVSYSALRQNLSHYMDLAVEGGAPILVTRQGGKGNVMIISENEFTGWQETIHLMRSPANAERLLRSVESANAGDYSERSLVENGEGFKS